MVTTDISKLAHLEKEEKFAIAKIKTHGSRPLSHITLHHKIRTNFNSATIRNPPSNP